MAKITTEAAAALLGSAQLARTVSLRKLNWILSAVILAREERSTMRLVF